MLMETLSMGWRRVRRTNTTDNGFPSRLIRATAPSGIGDSVAQATASAVIELSNQPSGVAQNAMIIMPYGAGSNDNTMSLRVIGWRKMIEEGNEVTSVWVPTVLVELACTLSSTPIGLAGKVIAATDLFADTIALTSGNEDVSVDIVSPTGDVAAHAVLDLKGFTRVEVTFTTGGSATNCNALVALL